jgi:hypothetical protein
MHARQTLPTTCSRQRWPHLQENAYMTAQFSDLQSRSVSPTAQQVVFLFDNLPDWQQLAAGVRAGVQLVVLDGTQDGLAQIAASLQGRQGVEAIHILSHGQPGSVQLGSFTLDQAALAARSDALAQIGSALGDSGDILLYGCDTAATGVGEAFVRALAEATGADIAASKDLTGSAGQGGNWALEFHQGRVDAASLSGLAGYTGLLAPPITENFDGVALGDRGGTMSYGPPGAPRTIGGWTFTFLNAAGTQDLSPDVYVDVTNDAMLTSLANNGSDKAAFLNGSYAPGTGNAAAVLKATSGEEFSFVSIRVENGASTGSDYRLVGYLNGITVAGASHDFTSGDYLGGGTEVSVSGPAWQYVDEVRIVRQSGATDISIFVDDIVVAAAVPPSPAITNATYDGSTGVLAVTGSNFEATDGASNDVVANKLTFTGEGGLTYTLTDTANVEISSASSFTLTLSATDRAALNQMVNKNSTSSTSGTTYNLAGAAGFVAAHAATADVSGNGITVSNVAVPTIISSTYDASTGVLVVTGTGLKTLNGAANDIVANKFTLRGEGGSTYLLTDTANVDITSDTSFTLTLSAADKAGANLLLNKNGTLSTDISTYNLAAAEDWAAGADAAITVADTTGNNVLVSNVAVPSITSATYDAATGTVLVTGTGFLQRSGASNDIAANRFTFSGEGGATYTLTDTSDVDVTNGSAFTLTLSATDKAAVDLLLNKNGSSAIDATGYNLAAAEDWARGADAAVVVADTTGNGIVVSDVVDPAPVVSSITRVGPASTNASSLSYVVTFSETVTGVDTSDFALTSTGSAAGTIAYITGSGSQYTVTVNGISGVGTLQLDLNGSGTGIVDSISTPAPGYWAGEVYTIDTVSPVVSSVAVPADATYAADQHLDFTLHFSEVVTVDTSGGTPRLAITLDTGGTVYATYLSTAGAELTFRAVVAAGWEDANGISLGSALDLNGATLRDAAGNNALLSLNNVGATSGVRVDAIAPEAPVSLALDAGSDSGVSNSDRITADTTPTISGLAEVDSIVTLYDSDGLTVLGSDVADASGIWSITSVALSEGSHTLSAKATDAAGNTGQASAALVLTIDSTPPTLAITTSAAVLASGETATITFTFSEDPGASFTWDGTIGDVVVTGGTLGAISGAGLTRTAIFTPTPATDAGTASITVAAGAYADTAGNGGLAGGPLALTFDTLAPATTVASFSFSADTGASSLDFVTHTAQQTISGTLSATLAVGEQVQVSLDDGDTWQQAFALAGSDAWSLADQTLVASNTLQARVVDAAGNAGEVSSQSYTLDNTAPSRTGAHPGDDATGVPVRDDIVLAFSEALDPVASDLTKVYLKDVATSTLIAATITLNASGELVIHPAASLGYSTAYYVTWDAGALQDLAGNAANAVSDKTSYNFTTLAAPPSPPVPTNPPVPAPISVDGVPVTTTPGEDGTTIISIPVIMPNRPDTPGTPSSLADIPLVTVSGGHIILQVSVPTGVGLQVQGIPVPLRGDSALADLIMRIERSAGGDAGLTSSGQAFLATLDPSVPLTTQTITATAGAGFNFDVPLVISGSAIAGDGMQAVILDARALPGGSTVQVDNVDFLAVVGAVRIIGGAGQNMASGDGAAQYIVLGADDDIIHGGGGNDTVGSKGGNDQLYGDAGDDIVFGGAGNDLLSGGSGSDRLNGGTGFDVALQEGKRSDYTVTLDGAGVKLTHNASGVSDWLVDVEQVRFATGPSLTVAHSEAEEAAAFLFQRWMGRDLTPSEGAVIQTLAGQTALQVADLFAQVYPQQAGGRTAEQLLDGMAGAGAIRVDAQRETAYIGDAGDNSFTPAPGLAWSVDGGAGIDTIVFPATLAQTHLEASATGFTLQRMTDGAMLELVNVERLTLEDTQLALDLDGHAGQAAKLIGAVAGAAFLDNKPLVGEVLRALDAGVSAQSLVQLGLQLLGAQTAGQVTQLLWTNVVGSAATPEQLQPFVTMMAQGMTGGELAVLASHLEFNATRIDLVGLAATGIEFA